MERRYSFYEFFAGGGMARAGLRECWDCAFANDISPMKAAAYVENWGGDHFVCRDIASVSPAELPGRADLAWASFPCQDLSLAGDRLGMAQTAQSVSRSGTFWPFWRLMQSLQRQGRGPRIVILENVCGLLTSRKGEDFASLCAAFTLARYRFGAAVIDARHFTAQSRPRVFFIAVEAETGIPPALISSGPIAPWHSKALAEAQSRLGACHQKNWLWWRVPTPPPRALQFEDMLDEDPAKLTWHSEAETARIIAMMTPVNAAKVAAALASGQKCAGAVYKRIRTDASGRKSQRAEVRFDGLAGCLRTPRGGSSRQIVLAIDHGMARSRRLSAREAARLMGLSDSYKLPARDSDAYHLAGDGVCAPAVAHIAEQILLPVLDAARRQPAMRAA